MSLYTASLPCCRDRFGEQACQSLRKAQPDQFEKRCLSDHDFSAIDCCAECRRYIEKNNIHPDSAKVVSKAPALCRDKHSVVFCRRFKNSGMGKFSCADAEFAVRVCRMACGYCNDELYSPENAPPLCTPIGAPNVTTDNQQAPFWFMNVTNPNIPQVWNSVIFKIYKVVENG
ncbi:hypothetical protein WR25_18681 [Diploscapter pachys]|uniref:Uncharacterized protein n=1 Tax=Diploscapter pachys TaxID=2018661 RepID=A0A2A2J9Z0_9BILA|nr:hypothetical protein WR25_18681 [Diploscapter pachys]